MDKLDKEIELLIFRFKITLAPSACFKSTHILNQREKNPHPHPDLSDI
jgi:hypothetical protein